MQRKDSGKKSEKAPQSLFQLLILLIKGILKSIPKALMRIAIIAGVVFIIHTYLVIYPNGGYWNMGTRLSKMLELKQSNGSGTLIWCVMSASILSTFAYIRAKGIGNFFKGLSLSVPRVITVFDRKNGMTMMLICVGAFLAGYYWIKNDMLTLVLAIALLLSMAAFRSSFTYVVMWLGYSDFNRLFHRENKVFKDRYQVILLFSVSLGFLLYTALPKRFLSVFLVVGISIGLGVLSIMRNKNQTKAAVVFLCFNLFGLFSYIVYGDDGGVGEAGGFINWIGSDGSFTAVTLGLPPAMGAGVTGFIGGSLGEIGVFDAVDELKHAESATTGVEEALTEELAEEPEPASEAADAKSISETVEDMPNMHEELMDPQMLDEILSGSYDELNGSVSDMHSDPQMLLNSLKESSGVSEDIISGLQKNVIDSESVIRLGDLMDSTGDGAELFEDLLPEESVRKSIIKPADIMKDSMEAFIKSDNAIYTSIKSWASSGFRDFFYRIGAKKGAPSPLGSIEVLTKIFFSGTKSDSDINPGKTIQGTTNCLMDAVSDWNSGSNDTASKLAAGEYGDFYRTMDQSFDALVSQKGPILQEVKKSRPCSLSEMVIEGYINDAGETSQAFNGGYNEFFRRLW